MNRYEKFGRHLTGLGYDITPLTGKIPLLKGWQTRPDTAKEFHKYDGKNIGLLCGGRHHIVAVDIDCKHERATEDIKNIMVDLLGFAPERIGNAPKTLFVFRCSEPFYKIKTGVYSVDGEDAAVECLAEGQQFVVSGQHPDTKSPYTWPRDSIMDIAPESLTQVSPEDLTEFISQSNGVLSLYGTLKSTSLSGNGKIKNTSNIDFAANEQTADLEKISTAMDFIPNGDLHYDDWVYVAHAIKGSCGEDGNDLFHKWSQTSAKYEPAETERLWKSIGTVTTIGAGSVFYMAQQNGYDATQNTFGPTDLNSVAAQPADVEAVVGDGSFTAASVSGPLPEREWVLDKWLPYKSVGMLFGAGGIGKSLLMQQLGNCVAEGRHFMGIETKQMPVLCVLCEDDDLEIKRRQLDINKWMGVDDFDSGPERCVLWPRIGKDNIIVTFPSQGADQAGQFFEELCEKVEQVKGDADDIFIVLDTAADMFGGNENVRREVNTFIKTYLGSVVLKYNATIVILAHPSLSGLVNKAMPGMSGSTAWENSVRSRSYLSRSEESDDVRVLSRKKSNYSNIDADSDITLMWDQGVLLVPASPDQVDKIQNRKLKNDILTEIEAAWCDGVAYKSNRSDGRKVRTSLPKAFQNEKPGMVLRAFNELVDYGNIVHIERKGFRVEKR